MVVSNGEQWLVMARISALQWLIIMTNIIDIDNYCQKNMVNDVDILT